MAGRLLPYGDRAVLVELGSLDEALLVHAALTGPRRPPGLQDAVVGARSVLLVADSPASLAQVRTQAQAATGRSSPDVRTSSSADHPTVKIPVRYDGPDLADVAELTGLSVSEVVRAHTSTVWAVGFAGFAPGFAYLVGGDPRLRVPRRAQPRTRVPAGAVALADDFSGIYPRASPGGWQLIGSTKTVLWDLDRDPPALLRPGTRVRFTQDQGAP